MEKLGDEIHPGDWRLHHISLPEGPGDFTPVRRDAHQEDEHHVFDAVWEALTGLVTGQPSREAEQADREAG